MKPRRKPEGLRARAENLRAGIERDLEAELREAYHAGWHAAHQWADKRVGEIQALPLEGRAAYYALAESGHAELPPGLLALLKHAAVETVVSTDTPGGDLQVTVSFGCHGRDSGQAQDQDRQKKAPQGLTSLDIREDPRHHNQDQATEEQAGGGD